MAQETRPLALVTGAFTGIGEQRSRAAPQDNVIAETAPPRDKMPALRVVDIHEGGADEPGGF